MGKQGRTGRSSAIIRPPPRLDDEVGETEEMVRRNLAHRSADTEPLAEEGPLALLFDDPEDSG